MIDSLLDLPLGEEAEPGHVGVQTVDVDIEDIEIRVAAWEDMMHKLVPRLTCG
jgi:hypothetical protein